MALLTVRKACMIPFNKWLPHRCHFTKLTQKFFLSKTKSRFQSSRLSNVLFTSDLVFLLTKTFILSTYCSLLEICRKSLYTVNRHTKFLITNNVEWACSHDWVSSFEKKRKSLFNLISCNREAAPERMIGLYVYAIQILAKRFSVPTKTDRVPKRLVSG